MKKHGILNSHIAKILADLGHTDSIVIADVGLPIPSHVTKIDLSLELGVPSFNEVVKIICEDMVVEKVTIAKELLEQNKHTYQFIHDQFKDVPVDELTHEQFKQETARAKAIIRTGEAKPYANCILYSGVNFGP